MRKIFVWAVFALLACPTTVVAQKAEMHGPPKVLEIIRYEDGKEVAIRCDTQPSAVFVLTKR